jgi:hypothetical protein
MFERTIAIREDGQQRLTTFGGKEGYRQFAQRQKTRTSARTCESSFYVIQYQAFEEVFGHVGIDVILGPSYNERS